MKIASLLESMAHFGWDLELILFIVAEVRVNLQRSSEGDMSLAF